MKNIYDIELYNILESFVYSECELGFALIDDKMKMVEGTEVYPLDVTLVEDDCIVLTFRKCKTDVRNYSIANPATTIIICVAIGDKCYNFTNVGFDLNGEKVNPCDEISEIITVYKYVNMNSDTNGNIN